jgi:hypothetical protein
MASGAVGDPAANAAKLGAVRILLGVILAWRTFFIARDTRWYFEPFEWCGIEAYWHAWVAWGTFALAVILTLGIASRLVALVMAVSAAWFASWTGTYNLGPMLSIPMLAGIAALGGGSWAIGRRASLPSAKDCSRVLFTLFLFTAALHFSALLFHLTDGYWLNGLTAAAMLTNSYLCRFYGFFRGVEQSMSGIFHATSVGIVIVQTVFQAAMVPLVFFRWGRWFVAVYGAAFALGSLVALQLSILPAVECVLWAWLFLPVTWLPRGLVSSGAVDEAFGSPASAVHAMVFGGLTGLFWLCAIAGRIGLGAEPAGLRPVFHHAGLISPNVFNRGDLSMGDRWTIVERITNDGVERIPLNGDDGQRLVYHCSDVLYYGNSLQWRRKMVTEEDMSAAHDRRSVGLALMRRIVRYDYFRRGGGDAATYRVSVFGNAASNLDHPAPDRYTSRLLDQFILVVDAQRVRKKEGR